VEPWTFLFRSSFVKTISCHKIKKEYAVKNSLFKKRKLSKKKFEIYFWEVENFANNFNTLFGFGDFFSKNNREFATKYSLSKFLFFGQNGQKSPLRSFSGPPLGKRINWATMLCALSKRGQEH
jgi:hypothetical protein